MVCSDNLVVEVKDVMSPVAKPAKVDSVAGKGFIECVRDGREDLLRAAGKVFKDADELLAYLLKP